MNGKSADIFNYKLFFIFKIKTVRIFLSIFFLFFTTNIFCQNVYWQQEVHYNIDVKLNDKDNSLTAFERILYINHSPDTLHFIWFHLWPNAYKNDRTAFSNQLLRNGSNDFYFSNDDARGYINQLDFKTNDSALAVEEDSANIDIIKLILTKPLPPKDSVEITTPFHEKLPENISRGGHIFQTYQITQWYPKPAVYDSRGWHPFPYLDQGEFYSEYGSFDVNITVPKNYIVASSGYLQNEDELQDLKTIGKLKPALQNNYEAFKNDLEAKAKFSKKSFEAIMPASSAQTKTLHYILDSVHDFAWFASKLFVVQYDTIQLPTHIVDAFSFYNPWQENDWNKSVGYIKDAVKFYSKKIGEYPYGIVSAVAGNSDGYTDGMEYPTITLITGISGGKDLDDVITHEVGHNWLYGILGTNERDHAWMDEGMNTFYENEYTKEKYGSSSFDVSEFENVPNKKLPEDQEKLMLESFIKVNKSQPIELTSDSFTQANYELVVYKKGSLWLQQLQQQLGTNLFDSSMHQYFEQWKFKHPYPEDFKKTIETASGQPIDLLYSKLFQTTSLYPAEKKQIKFTTFFNLKNTNKYNYISVLPAIGANAYDRLMVGIMIHNYQLPLNNFDFFVAPLYATASKALNGAGRFSYNIFKKRSWLEFSVSGEKYSINETDQNVPVNGQKLYFGITRIVPSVKITLYDKDVRSTRKYFIQARTFLLSQEQPVYSSDTLNPLVAKQSVSTTIDQLKFGVYNTRSLYPYEANLQIDQGAQFVRAGFTGKYFFNYGAGKDGLTARFFAGKFFYLVSNTPVIQSDNSNFELTMTGPKGNEDFTYSDYFAGRNEFQGWQSQQIMERDGFFKVGTPLLNTEVGKTDNWLMALNLSGDIPHAVNPLNIFPFKIPVQLFLDIGTNDQAWQDNPATGKFLYDAGFQISVLKKAITVYVPVFYSSVFSNYYKSIYGNSAFWHTVSFSINLNAFQLRKINSEIPL
jgi:hypothetical protein